ncbi:MAG: hypothetical protein RR482_00070 [Clostridia bacterium]
MARFKSVNVDEMADELKRLGQITSPMAMEMIDAGAKIIKDAWKRIIDERGHVKTGAMRDSVEADPPKNNGSSVSSEIYPRGKDKKGVRNAEKAFLLHYGWEAGKPTRGKEGGKGHKGAHKGDHFVDTVENECMDAVGYAMENVRDRYMKGD